MTEQPATDPLPPFATAEQLEQFTKGKLKEADLRTADAVAAVSRSIRNHIHWHAWPLLRGHSVTLDGPGGLVLSLPTLRLVELVSLSELGQAADVAAEVDWSETGLVRKVNGRTWTTRYRKIVAVMDHGHTEAEDLKQITLQLAARALSSPMGATREQAGSVSVNWAMATQGVSGGLLPLAGELSIVEKYRRTAD